MSASKYVTYRLANNISINTVKHEQQIIFALMSFINHKYKKKVVYHEIRPIDIEQFLDAEREKGLQDSTIYKKIIIIKQWFNYLWKTKQIAIDFMPKFSYADKLDLHVKKKVTLNYEKLLMQKADFLQQTNVLLVSKLLFLFYMHGIRLRDIIRIDIDNIQIRPNGIHVLIYKTNQNVFELTFSEDEEVSVLLQGIERAVFRNTHYLFSSRSGDQYDIFKLGSLKSYHEQINNYFDTTIRSEELRFAYVHYLYNAENQSVDDISKILGINLPNAASLVKEACERSGDVRYEKGTDRMQFT